MDEKFPVVGSSAGSALYAGEWKLIPVKKLLGRWSKGVEGDQKKRPGIYGTEIGDKQKAKNPPGRFRGNHAHKSLSLHEPGRQRSKGLIILAR